MELVLRVMFVLQALNLLLLLLESVKRVSNVLGEQVHLLPVMVPPSIKMREVKVNARFAQLVTSAITLQSQSADLPKAAHPSTVMEQIERNLIAQLALTTLLKAHLFQQIAKTVHQESTALIPPTSPPQPKCSHAQQVNTVSKRHQFQWIAHLGSTVPWAQQHLFPAKLENIVKILD
jgi:hypothetical protein